MPASDSAADKIMCIIKDERADAYRQGWEDAVQHIMSSASKAVQPSPTAQTSKTKVAQRSGRKASYGSVPEFSIRALATASDDGISVNDVVNLAREHGEDIAESSVRRTLNAFVGNGRARKARGRWFRLKTIDWSDGSPQAVSADGDDPPTDDQDDSWNGGRDAAA